MVFRGCLVLILFLLSACATPPNKTPSQLLAENKAIVYGYQESLARVIILPLGVSISVSIEYVNGISKFSPWRGYALQAELRPGENTVHVVCSGRVRGEWVTGEDVVLVDAEPGHIYILVPEPKNVACSVEPVDVTEKYAAR